MTNIKVLSTHAVQEVLRELGPAFEHASGASLKIHYDPANVLKRKIEDGATFRCDDRHETGDRCAGGAGQSQS